MLLLSRLLMQASDADPQCAYRLLVILMLLAYYAPGSSCRLLMLMLVQLLMHMDMVQAPRARAGSCWCWCMLIQPPADAGSC